MQQGQYGQQPGRQAFGQQGMPFGAPMAFPGQSQPQLWGGGKIDPMGGNQGFGGGPGGQQYPWMAGMGGMQVSQTDNSQSQTDISQSQTDISQSQTGWLAGTR